jgi:hypothetical protein
LLQLVSGRHVLPDAVPLIPRDQRPGIPGLGEEEERPQRTFLKGRAYIVYQEATGASDHRGCPWQSCVGAPTPPATGKMVMHGRPPGYFAAGDGMV